MRPFLAMITPLTDARPDNSLPEQPPYPSQGPGFPTHPIAPGGPPLGTWGGVGQPYPDQGLPGAPPYPSQGPGFPTHPIAPGGPPLGTWGGVGQPYPDQGLPGAPPYPSQGPGFPTQLPMPGGQLPYPDNSLPGAGLGTWGGGNVPMPTPPIWLPPQAPVVDPDDPQRAYVVAYAPKADGSGYERITFTVEIPPPTVPTEPSPKS